LSASKSVDQSVVDSARILILDEATANIDTITEVLIQKALEQVLHDRTAVVIAHRLSTVRRADWIYVINDGRIIEQGTHASLQASGGLYSSLYQKQFIDAEP
jgi:ABC-type multidrug transport system fused ATPase/permease subunit